MRTPRFVSAALVAGALAFGVAACGDDDSGDGTSTEAEAPDDGGDASGGVPTGLSGELVGAGASSQEAAQEAWIAGLVNANDDLTASYDPIGSGGGREQFIAGGSDYGGTDAAFADEELEGAIKRCEDSGGELIQAPSYISPIAIIYNLDGVETLQLSPSTLASIFKEEITEWNDPAIAEDNPDVELPSERITPVHRSDESGTTENFVEYMSEAAADIWDFEVSGDWPLKSGEAAKGTSGVVDAVSNGSGTIGYADASQAGGLGVALIGVGEEFTGPTPEAAAAIVDNSPSNNDAGEYVFEFELDRATEASGTYPVVLVSYLMGCTAYDSAETAANVQGMLGYIISPEGQDAAAANAGSAPISDDLRSKIQPAVDSITG